MIRTTATPFSAWKCCCSLLISLYLADQYGGENVSCGFGFLLILERKALLIGALAFQRLSEVEPSKSALVKLAL